MAVRFAPLFNDGTELIDGTHDATVSDAMAAQILTALGLPTTIPGQAPGRDVYAAIETFIAGPTYAAMTPAQQDLVQRVRIAIGAAARIESGIIGWRSV
jgi:hypothetical protein